MNTSAITGFGSRVFGIYQSVTQKVRHWRRWFLILCFAIAASGYLWDVFSTRTFINTRMLTAGQNSNNYVVSFEAVDDTSNGLPRVIDVRNVRQLSDFNIFPSNLQEKAASLAEYNRRVAAKEITGDPRLVTVRVSGWSFGNADKSANITQIDPTLPTWSYNVIGALLVFIYFAALIVGIPSLAIEAVRPGNDSGKRKVALSLTGVLALFYFIDWFII